MGILDAIELARLEVLLAEKLGDKASASVCVMYDDINRQYITRPTFDPEPEPEPFYAYYLVTVDQVQAISSPGERAAERDRLINSN